MNEFHGEVNRRDFFKFSAALGMGTASLASISTGAEPETKKRTPFAAPPMDSVRIGIVGVGGMGTAHVSILAGIPNAIIKAVADINEAHAQRAAKIITDAGHPAPTLYTKGERDFERLCATEELDVVYTATPWRWHVPVCVAAMTNGKHAVTEVPAAYTVDDCWKLVETAEKEQKHCVMLENCNYDREEMLCLNMARQGILGEVLHGECGYLHDLRGIKFSKSGEGLWRREHSRMRNGNLYPTHGLGPVAQCMDINRGDRLDYLVSMSSPSRGLQLWRDERLPQDDPRKKEKYILGDVNATLIKTVKGKTIYVVHDTNLPRPYTRIHRVQGTRGIFEKWPHRIHVEGKSPGHGWETLEKYYEEFEHPLWKGDEAHNAKVGHGGMDYLENRRLVHCLREGKPTDMNVYDAAMLSCICELTERSVANRSMPQDVPDFTRGNWS